MRAGIACACLSCLASLSACGYLGDSDLYGLGVGELSIEAFEPPPGATDVPVNKTLAARFNIAPAGESITTFSARVFSGVMEAPGEIRVDQLQRQLRFAPSGNLRPSLRYTLLIEDGIRGLDGSVLVDPAAIEFTTGTERLDPDPPAEPVTAEQIQPIWQKYCVSCHGSESPRSGVNLSSTAASVRSLRNVASLGSALPRVRPGDHSRSYLTRKLLGSFGFQGFPMPPSDPRLTDAEMRLVTDWIDDGAL